MRAVKETKHSPPSLPIRRLVPVAAPSSSASLTSVLESKSWKPIRVDNWSSFFLNRLHDLFQAELQVDLVLRFPHRQIKVHSIVLNACTDFFNRLRLEQRQRDRRAQPDGGGHQEDEPATLPVEAVGEDQRPSREGDGEPRDAQQLRQRGGQEQLGRGDPEHDGQTVESSHYCQPEEERRHEEKDGSQDVLRMPNEIDAEAMLAVIKFLYTGKLLIEQGQYSRVREVVDKLNLSLLARIMDAQVQQEGLQRTSAEQPKNQPQGMRKVLQGDTEQPRRQQQHEGQQGGRPMLSYREWRRQTTNLPKERRQVLAKSNDHPQTDVSKATNGRRRGLKRKRSGVENEESVEASFDRICQLQPRNDSASASEQQQTEKGASTASVDHDSDEELELSCAESEFLQEQQKRVYSNHQVQDEEEEHRDLEDPLEDCCNVESFEESTTESMKVASEDMVTNDSENVHLSKWSNRSILKRSNGSSRAVVPVKRSVRFSLRPSPTTKKNKHSNDTSVISDQEVSVDAIGAHDTATAAEAPSTEVTFDTFIQETSFDSDIGTSELPPAIDIRDDIRRADGHDDDNEIVEKTIFAQQSVRINKLALIRKLLQASPNLRSAKRVRIKVVKKDAQGKEVHQTFRLTAKANSKSIRKESSTDKSSTLKPLPMTDHSNTVMDSDSAVETAPSSEADSLFNVASGIATSLGVNNSDFEASETLQEHPEEIVSSDIHSQLSVGATATNT